MPNAALHMFYGLIGLLTLADRLTSPPALGIWLWLWLHLALPGAIALPLWLTALLPLLWQQTQYTDD